MLWGLIPVLSLIVLTRNTADSQVYSTPMRDVDHAARQPVLIRRTVELPPGTLGATVNTTFTVPPGKRLMITQVQVTARDVVGQGEPAPIASVITANSLGQGAFGNPDTWIDLTARRISAGTTIWFGGETVNAYSDPGYPLAVKVLRDTANTHGFGDFDITGYLVNLP